MNCDDDESPGRDSIWKDEKAARVEQFYSDVFMLCERCQKKPFRKKEKKEKKERRRSSGKLALLKQYGNREIESEASRVGRRSSHGDCKSWTKSAMSDDSGILDDLSLSRMSAGSGDETVDDDEACYTEILEEWFLAAQGMEDSSKANGNHGIKKREEIGLKSEANSDDDDDEDDDGGGRDDDDDDDDEDDDEDDDDDIYVDMNLMREKMEDLLFEDILKTSEMNSKFQVKAGQLNTPVKVLFEMKI